MSTVFGHRVSQIKGLSDRRRLPRLGRIRLGLKAVTSGGKEYPKETEYFVCPPEVQKIYGPKPTDLDIMIPLNDTDAVFPCAYKYYGSSKGLKCSGDGEIAHRVNEETKGMELIKCPCQLLEDKKCKQMGTLMVILPKVSMGGVYQITTSSINSIIDVNSGMDYIAALLGRFAMVPCTLRRVKTETHHDDKKQNHYTMQIIFDGDVTTLNALRADTVRVLEHPRFQLPAPLDENPAMDPIDIVADEEDNGNGAPPLVQKTQPEPDKAAQEPLPVEAKKDKPAKKQRTDYGIAIKCPERPEGKQLRPKTDCDTCKLKDGCPAQ